MNTKIKKITEAIARKYKKSPLAQAICITIPKIGPAIDRYLTATAEIEKEFPNKEEYNEVVIKELQSHPNSLRAIVMGPYFLHPRWVIDRREKQEDRKSFSLPLRTYLEETHHQPERKVRLIIRNSPRYLKYLIEKVSIKPEEVHDLIHEMLRNLDILVKIESFSFCCADVGYYENVVIT
jgi:hypothetical protein